MYMYQLLLPFCRYHLYMMNPVPPVFTKKHGFVWWCKSPETWVDNPIQNSWVVNIIGEYSYSHQKNNNLS